MTGFDEILQNIRENYPTAIGWSEDARGLIHVQMRDLDLLGGIAPDLEIGFTFYSLTSVTAAVSLENRGDLFCIFTPQD